jgi:hypothetical protein
MARLVYVTTAIIEIFIYICNFIHRSASLKLNERMDEKLCCVVRTEAAAALLRLFPRELRLVLGFI